MTIEEAREAIGQKVRPSWCTSQAHWNLKRVYNDGNALITTNRGRARVERVSELHLTFGSVKRMRTARRTCNVCGAICKSLDNLNRHTKRVHGGMMEG